MADLIKKIKIKKQDGTFTDYIPIGAEAQNISTNDGDSVQLKLNKKPYYYNNVAEMKADKKLKVGDMAITLGYYEPNDGGGAEYIIINKSTNDYIDNNLIIELNNVLIAKLIIKDFANIKQFGIKENEDISNILELSLLNFKNTIIPNGKYKISKAFKIKANTSLFLSIGTILEVMNNSINVFSLDRKAILDGNGGYIKVQNDFTGKVIVFNADTDVLDDIKPYQNNSVDTQTNFRKYLRNINIVKYTTSGICRPVSLSDISGTAIHFYSNNLPSWGITVENINICGAFEYGIDMLRENSGWIHDTIFKDIFIQYPRNNVHLKNIDNAYFYNLIIQPSYLNDESTKYVKTAIWLENSQNINYYNSLFWDWNVADQTDETKKQITLNGKCQNVSFSSINIPTNILNLIYYDNIITAKTLKIKSLKNNVIIPELSTYKNKRLDGSYEWKNNNINGYDIQNTIRYEIPIEIKNPYSNENAFYKIGYFYFKDSENPTDGFDDLLIDELITIEENNSMGINGYTNLRLVYNASENKISISNCYYNTFNYCYTQPLYYYTFDSDTKKVTIYRMIKNLDNVQQVYNNSLYITNARRFYLEHEYIQNGVLENAILFNITKEIKKPKYVGEMGYSTTLNKPYWVKQSETYNQDGSIKSEAVYVDSTGSIIEDV